MSTQFQKLHSICTVSPQVSDNNADTSDELYIAIVWGHGSFFPEYLQTQYKCTVVVFSVVLCGLELNKALVVFVDYFFFTNLTPFPTPKFVISWLLPTRTGLTLSASINQTTYWGFGFCTVGLLLSLMTARAFKIALTIETIDATVIWRTVSHIATFAVIFVIRHPRHRQNVIVMLVVKHDIKTSFISFSFIDGL